MEVIDIHDDETMLRMFRQLPYSIYKDDRIWAPGSETLFKDHWTNRQDHSNILFRPVVVLEDQHPVARAVAILKVGAAAPDGTAEGYIGFFECREGRAEAASRLLTRCESLLLAAGASSVVAPKVDNQVFGCQVGGFDLPHLCLTPHNPSGYSDHFKSAGYGVRDRLLSLIFTRDTAPQINVTLPGISTREFDRTRLEAEIRHFHDLQSAIFGGRAGYIPRSLAEDREMIGGLLPFLMDDLVIVAEDGNRNIVGILVGLPDFYQTMAGHKVNRLRIVSIGARPGYGRRGVGALMAAQLMRNLSLRPEITFAEASVVLSRNMPPQNLAKRFNARPGRTFEVLAKVLE